MSEPTMDELVAEIVAEVNQLHADTEEVVRRSAGYQRRLTEVATELSAIVAGVSKRI